MIEPRIGYGCLQLVGDRGWGEGLAQEDSVRILRRAAELGVRLFDVAEAYGPELGELVLKESLYPYADLLIATKGGVLRREPGEWLPSGDPDSIKSSCFGSLTRLSLECIPLYQLHMPDPLVPFSETVGALDELRRAGFVQRIGLCNVSLEQLREAQNITEIYSVQNGLNLQNRGSLNVMQACEEDGIVFIPWFPLGGGSLGRMDRLVGRIAARRGATNSQIALAWLLAISSVTAPIPGTRSVVHLKQNVAAERIVLDEDELRWLSPRVLR